MAGGALGLAGNFRGERWGAGGGIGEDRGDLLLLDREIGRDNRPTCKFHSKTAVAAKKSPSNSSADDADTRAMKFEQAFGELEMLIGQMEGDELPLDEMVKAYERGTRLWNQCKLRLDEARLKVEAITKPQRTGKWRLRRLMPALRHQRQRSLLRNERNHPPTTRSNFSSHVPP